MDDGDGGGLERSVLGQALSSALTEIGPKGSSPGGQEMDALKQLFMMAFVPTGKEDPRAILSGMSDGLIEHVTSRLEEAKKNPVVAQIGQFFLIEWCYRNGYLNGDWIWSWSGTKKGQLHYDPRIPLNMVPLPSTT